jgi:hypothetical protein
VLMHGFPKTVTYLALFHEVLVEDSRNHKSNAGGRSGARQSSGENL